MHAVQVLLPMTIQTANQAVFLESWTAEIDNDNGCQEGDVTCESTDPPQDCDDPQQESTAEELCGSLIDLSGPFQVPYSKAQWTF